MFVGTATGALVDAWVGAFAVGRRGTLVALVARAGADGVGAGVEHAANKPSTIIDKINWNSVFMVASF